MNAFCILYLSQHLATLLLLTFTFTLNCNGLTEESSSTWRPLPHFGRREILVSGAALATATATATTYPNNAVASAVDTSRSVASIDSHLAIPVWPSWGGGRVVPISLEGRADPFLLLAHHKHWFDPKDPLREPFKAAGKALGLPYVDVEGFSMHPHRGLDILTYVIDGSDGFRHKDSLGVGSRVYRGGCAQWMRTGAGVMHEEYWETRADRRTSIELFQLWINLPKAQKLDPPAVRYVGDSTTIPWHEETLPTGVRVRDISQTLDLAFSDASTAENNADADVDVRPRPPVQIQHVQIPAGATWEASIPRSHSALMYVREGVATLDGEQQQQFVNALQSATFHSNGDTVRLRNTQSKRTLDLLLLAGQPLREPVALGGPIVMNTEQELYDAYQQLSDGTFLDRDVALRQQAVTSKRTG